MSHKANDQIVDHIRDNLIEFEVVYHDGEVTIYAENADAAVQEAIERGYYRACEAYPAQ